MTKLLDSIQKMETNKLIEYHQNPKEHPKEQIDKLASSIKEYGFDQPIVVDEDLVIIKGHGRLKASKKLGLEYVPIIKREDLSEAQIKGARIADNKTAESEWNMEKLGLELEGLNEVDDFDIEKSGFGKDEIGDLFNDIMEEQKEEELDKYTQKIKSPHYEPTGEKPSINELLDDSKAKKLLSKIENSGVSQRQKDFLKKDSI